MFGRRQKPYDKEGKVPVIRSSICTGEQVAGFKELSGGRFEELMLIRDSRDLEEFMRLYHVEEREISREW